MRRGTQAVGGLTLARIMVACGAGDNGGGAATGATAGSSPAATEAQRHFEMIYFRGAFGPDAGHWWLGDSLGYWADEDLSVSVQTSGGSSDSVRLLGTGNGDVAYPSAEAVLIGREQGLELTDFYCHIQTPIFMVGVPEGSDIESPEQLAGKRVGVQSHGSTVVNIVRSLVDEAGGDAETINFIETGVGAVPIEAVRQEEVDAVGYWDTQFLLFERSGIDLRVFPTPFDNFFSSGLLVREPDIEEYAEELTRFARAFTRTVVFALENPAAAVDLMGEQIPEFLDDRELSIALLERRNQRLVLPAEAGGVWGWNTHERWGALQDFLLSQGLLQEEQDIERVFTPALLDGVNDFDEEAVREQARSHGS